MPIFIDITNTLNGMIHTININQISLFNRFDGTLILSGISEPIKVRDTEIPYIATVINKYKIN